MDISNCDRTSAASEKQLCSPVARLQQWLQGQDGDEQELELILQEVEGKTGSLTRHDWVNLAYWLYTEQPPKVQCRVFQVCGEVIGTHIEEFLLDDTETVSVELFDAMAATRKYPALDDVNLRARVEAQRVANVYRNGPCGLGGAAAP